MDEDITTDNMRDKLRGENTDWSDSKVVLPSAAVSYVEQVEHFS